MGCGHSCRADGDWTPCDKDESWSRPYPPSAWHGCFHFRPRCRWRGPAVKRRSASPSDRPIFLTPHLMKTFHTLGALIAAAAEQNEIKTTVPFILDGGGDDPRFIAAWNSCAVHVFQGSVHSNGSLRGGNAGGLRRLAMNQFPGLGFRTLGQSTSQTNRNRRFFCFIFSFKYLEGVTILWKRLVWTASFGCL